jgi:ADP-ribosylglycohydrolase
MDESVLKSKFIGALVGTGLGDALGAPFEGRRQVKPEEIDWITERLETLTYTDDTHMMIGVAESLVRVGGFDGADTIGAMTGAISGAYLGASAIPNSWRRKLENDPYIEELAEKLKSGSSTS